MFIAHVANLTRQIRLGTGVTSLPYHNPLWTADRMLFLDHLTRGRMMLGVGSGALPTDYGMIGLGPAQMRGALEEDVDVLMHLLHSDEPLTVKTERYEMVGARTQFRPYTYPMFETAVTAVTSPTGPRIAGKHGMGVISVAASSDEGFAALADHWSVVEDKAAEHGQPVPSRSSWRLVAPMHLAPTRQQAIDDVQFGLAKFQEYFLDVLSGSILRAQGRTTDELVEWINESGFGVIGTPDDAIEMIERLREQSEGFGCFLLFHHEWALPDATQRHYELFARFVRPHFQHVTDRLVASADWCRSVTKDLRPQVVDAAAQAIARHEEERGRPPGPSRGAMS
jgi:limonene 1,2-monooxygenase